MARFPRYPGAMDGAFPIDPAPARPLFSPGAVWLTAGAAALALIGVVVAQITDRSELLMPIDPGLEAGAIGIGVFAGLLVDAVLFTAQWRKTDSRLVFALAVIPVLSVMMATYAARRMVEYRAFHGLPIVTAPTTFTITGVSSGRGGPSLRLIGGPGQRTFSIAISRDVYGAARVGEHVVLPVQTGRDGIRRMLPRPLAPGDLLP